MSNLQPNPEEGPYAALRGLPIELLAEPPNTSIEERAAALIREDRRILPALGALVARSEFGTETDQRNGVKLAIASFLLGQQYADAKWLESSLAAEFQQPPEA